MPAIRRRSWCALTARSRACPANGTPLGMLEDGEYTVDEGCLKRRDQIVLYTDGFTEAQNSAGEFFGLKRLRDTVREHAAESCRELHASILWPCGSSPGMSPQRDDMTLAVVEYLPE